MDYDWTVWEPPKPFKDLVCPEFKPGQIWVCSRKNDITCVFEIGDDENPAYSYRKILTGDYQGQSGIMISKGDRGRWCRLVQDVNEPVPREPFTVFTDKIVTFKGDKKYRFVKNINGRLVEPSYRYACFSDGITRVRYGHRGWRPIELRDEDIGKRFVVLQDQAASAPVKQGDICKLVGFDNEWAHAGEFKMEKQNPQYFNAIWSFDLNDVEQLEEYPEDF